MTSQLSPTDRRRAADQLGVPPDADPADARAAFLRRLPSAGFCPPPPLCAAAAGLAGRPVPGSSGVLAEPDDDDSLQKDVAAFAGEFWSIRPDVRRGRWQDLLGQVGGDPRLTTSLRRLEAGVDLRDATGVPGPPRQRELVGMIQTLFVLGPIERAARRREMLDALPPPVLGWEQAARQVERDLPAYASLEPALMDRLAGFSRRMAAPAAMVARPAPSWGFQAQVGLTIPQAQPVTDRRPRRWSQNWTVVWLIGLVFILGIQVGLNGSKESPAPTDPARKSPLSSHGQLPLPPKQEPVKYRQLSDDEIRSANPHFVPQPTPEGQRP